MLATIRRSIGSHSCGLRATTDRVVLGAGPGWAVRLRAFQDRGAAPSTTLRAARCRTPPLPQAEAGMGIVNEELTPIVTLDLRAINAVITEDEGDLIMLVDDG